MYIQGSNVSPQVSHGLNNLWKNKNEMSEDARALFEEWAYNSEVEINLQGGYHSSLEELYDNIKGIKGIPSAKFNESQEALAGACTVVTFVADKRIVALNNYIRFQRVSSKKLHELKELTYGDLEIDGENTSHSLSAKVTDEEIFVAYYISRLRTIS